MKTRVDGRHTPPLALAAMISVAALNPVTQAQTTWYVDVGQCPGTGTGSSANPFCSIQEGIDAAVDGDEVLVRPGVYHEAITIDGKSIFLRSQDGRDTTILDGAGLNQSMVTCMNQAAPTITGFTFRNGSVSPNGFGAAVLVTATGGAPTIYDCAFVDNTASQQGGAICVMQGSLTVAGCTFTHNVASGGGAIYTNQTTVNLTDSSFTGNMADGGGAAHMTDTTGSITDCVFDSNDGGSGGGAFSASWIGVDITGCQFEHNVAEQGGAIYVYDWDNLYYLTNLTASSFVQNMATMDGGAMFTSAGTAWKISACDFLLNHATHRGGAMFMTAGNPLIARCSFLGNSAAQGGAHAYETWEFGAASAGPITSSTFVGNGASSAGGAVFQADDVLVPVVNDELSSHYVNCTFADNGAPSGRTFASSSAADPTSATFDNCILFDGGDEVWSDDGSTVTITYSDVEGGYPGIGNIDTDPLFVLDPNTAGNGLGDLRLLADSPCIDAGDNARFQSWAGNFDLDGLPRFVDDACAADTGSGTPPIIDMGAYEYRGCYERHSRYLTIHTNQLGSLSDVALRITCTNLDGFAEFNGAVLWAGPQTAYPDENSDDSSATFLASGLQCEPYYADWGTQARLVVFGAEIVPDSTYLVEVMPNGGGEPTASTTVNTGAWGDVVRPFIVDSQPQPDFTDIAAIVSKFLADPAAPPKADVQLVPNVVLPNRPIDFNDISADVNAFLTQPYWSHPSATGPCTCPSDVTCGATLCQSDGPCGSGFCIDGACRDACGRCAP